MDKRNPLIVMFLIVILVSGAAMGLAYVVPRVTRAIVEAFNGD